MTSVVQGIVVNTGTISSPQQEMLQKRWPRTSAEQEQGQLKDLRIYGFVLILFLMCEPQPPACGTIML